MGLIGTTSSKPMEMWRPRRVAFIRDQQRRFRAGFMAECAGLTEMTPMEAERIKEIIDRLIRKPATNYQPNTHLTEHHIELTDYTPIRHHPRRQIDSQTGYELSAKYPPHGAPHRSDGLYANTSPSSTTLTGDVVGGASSCT